MEFFIITILAAASLQSAVKLTLLPRLFRYGITMLAVLPVFFLEKRVAALNLQDISAFLNDGSHLIDLCTLVVVQELLSLIVGFSLVGEIELGGKRHYWKYAALLPSLLMPVAALYLQAMAFNHLTNYSFGALTWAAALGYAAAVIIVSELLVLWRGNRLRRIASALNASWLLLMLAVFLPVTASCRISGMTLGGVSWRDLSVLGILAAAIVLMTFITYGLKIFMEKRRKI